MIYSREDLSFQVLSVQKIRHADGYFKVKGRPFAAISIRLGGKSDFEVAGRQLSVNTGDILYIPADMPYEVESYGTEMIVAHLRDCNYCEPIAFRPQNPTLLRMLFSQLLDAFTEGKSANRMKSIIYSILDEMENDKRTAHGAKGFEACLAFMEAHFSESTLSVTDVAAAGFMSQSTLGRCFRERFGLSPKAYLCRLRMNKAVALLSGREASVKEIALACGFADEKFFSRAFKKKYGLPPSSLQKNYIG